MTSIYDSSSLRERSETSQRHFGVLTDGELQNGESVRDWCLWFSEIAEGAVVTLLDEPVSFSCAWVVHIGVHDYIPGLQYHAWRVNFLLNRGGLIPSPALLHRSLRCLTRDILAMVCYTLPS